MQIPSVTYKRRIAQKCSFQVDKEDLLKGKKSEGLGRKQQTSLLLFADSMIVTEKSELLGVSVS